MDPTAPVFNGHRGELHEIVFEYARDELGIPIHLGKRAVQYFEDGKKAGIELENGEKVLPSLQLSLNYLESLRKREGLI
jgi:DNA-binding XRE family transcriptional regulator